jgi:putative Mg2+ transporter-C (MgtC) family protein
MLGVLVARGGDMELDLLARPDFSRIAEASLRLLISAVLGGVVGAEREAVGKAAGLRTHMMVSLGATLFVLGAVDAGATTADMTRVIQGIATGIGFIGAGTILKRKDQDQIEGLTTAATIWFTGAIGIAVGMGRAWLAIVCAVTAWVILAIIPRIESRFRSDDKP